MVFGYSTRSKMKRFGEAMTDVRLEPLSLAHLDGVMSWINDPEVTFYFANLSGEITREQEKAYLRVLLTSQTDKIFSIFENDE